MLNPTNNHRPFISVTLFSIGAAMVESRGRPRDAEDANKAKYQQRLNSVGLCRKDAVISHLYICELMSDGAGGGNPIKVPARSAQ